MSHTYVIEADPKTLKEALGMAQAGLGAIYHPDAARRAGAVLGQLAAECDRKRPVGQDGKHGDRHTDECGCQA